MIIYTLYFAPSKCVNYRTPRLLTNEVLEADCANHYQEF
jgi:hypothetical protein